MPNLFYIRNTKTLSWKFYLLPDIHTIFKKCRDPFIMTTHGQTLRTPLLWFLLMVSFQHSYLANSPFCSSLFKHICRSVLLHACTLSLRSTLCPFIPLRCAPFLSIRQSTHGTDPTFSRLPPLSHTLPLHWCDREFDCLHDSHSPKSATVLSFF